MKRRPFRSSAPHPFTAATPPALSAWLFVFMLAFMGGTAHAQLRELVVEPSEASDQGVVVYREYPEEAVVIVNSTLTNLTFDSNMGGIVADRSEPAQGIYRLIVRPYTQIFTVSAPGFMQARFRVAGLEPRQVVQYTIEPKDPDSGRLPVNFRIDPQGASLFVGDSQEDPSRPVQLAEGEHPVRIELVGHRTVNDTIVVSRDRTLFEYELQLLEQEVVRFRSTPGGATLYLDNIREGITDLDNFYYPGQYLVRLTLDGYRDLERQITIVEGGENLFEFELEKFATTLTLEVEPADARVFIDGRNIGEQRTLDLRPGIVRIDVDRDGFKPYTEQLTLQAGQTVDRRIELDIRSGTLQFRVLPVGATAYLADQQGEVVRQWSGTQLLRDIPVGTYNLVTKAEGHTTTVEQVTIREGESFPYTVELQSGPVGLAESRMLAEIRRRQALDGGSQTPLADRVAEMRGQAEAAGTPDPTPTGGQTPANTVPNRQETTGERPTEGESGRESAQRAPTTTPNPQGQANQAPTTTPPSSISSTPSTRTTPESAAGAAAPQSPSSKYGAFYIGTSFSDTYVYDEILQPVFDGNQSLHAGIMSMGRFFLLDLRAGYSRLMFANPESLGSAEYMEQVYGAAGLGAHIKLGPIDLYGLVGASASEYTFDTGIDEEIHNQNDTYYELGGHLLLGRSFGLKYGYRQTFDSGLDDFNDVQWHDASILFRF